MRRVLGLLIWLLVFAPVPAMSGDRAGDGFVPVSQIPHRGGTFLIAPDKTWFLNLADSDAAIDLWDIRSGTLLRTLAGTGKEIAAAAISADSRYIRVRLKLGGMRLFEASTGKQVPEPALETVFATEQITTEPVNLRFWSIGKVPNPIPPYLHESQKVLLGNYLANEGNKLAQFIRSDDGKHLLLKMGGQTKIWDTAADTLLVSIKDDDPQFARDTWCRGTGVSHFLMDGRNLVWADESHFESGEPTMKAGVALVESGTVKPLWGAQCVGGKDSFLRIGGPQTRLVTMFNPNVLTVWDSRTLQPMATFGQGKLHLNADGDIGTISSDGKTIAIPVQDTGRKERARGGPSISIWLKDVSGIRLLPSNLAHLHGGLAFSPLGKWLVAKDDKQVYEVWDVTTGKQVLSDPARQRAITSVSFRRPDYPNETIASPNGRYALKVAEGPSTSGTVGILVSAKNGRELLRLNFGYPADWIEFSRSNAKLLAQYGDQLTQWDIASARRDWDVVTDYTDIAFIRADGSYRTSAGGKHLLRLVLGFESKALP